MPRVCIMAPGFATLLRRSSMACSRKRAIGSGRFYIFSIPAFYKDSVERPRAGGDYRDPTGHVEPDNRDNDNPTCFEAYKFDSDAVVDIDTQIAKMSGCTVFVSESFAAMCRGPAPKAAILNVSGTE